MRKALVIGINNYPQVPLSGCINDASAFGAIIGTNGDDSPNFDVKLRTDILTKSELKGSIVELFRGESETTVLYFSGHGFLDELGGYLVTPDYRPHDEGVSMDEILILANESRAKNRVIILDCCHSGAFGSPKNGGGKSAHIGEGVSILTASNKNEPSVEINGHGIFTNLLLDSLRGGASDLRGHITPGSIYAYIDQALGPWEQRPVFKTNITKFISLRNVVPQVPTDILRKLTEYFPDPTCQYSLDPSFEYTNAENIEHKIIEPFARPENVAAFKNLQKLQSVGLIIPVGEKHMYYAALNSKACQLTALGFHYWRLVKDKRI